MVADLSDQIITITMSAQWSGGEQISYRLVSLVTYWSPSGHINHILVTLVNIGHILVNIGPIGNIGQHLLHWSTLVDIVDILVTSVTNWSTY